MTKVKQIKRWEIYKLNKKEVYEVYSKYSYALVETTGFYGGDGYGKLNSYYYGQPISFRYAFKLFATMEEAIEYINNWNPRKKCMNPIQLRSEYIAEQLEKKRQKEEDEAIEEQRRKDHEYFLRGLEIEAYIKRNKPSRKKYRPCLLNIFNPFFTGKRKL